MHLLGGVLLAVLFVLAVFTLANWSVLSASATLSFIVFEVDGPLGVVLLGIMLVLVMLFMLYVLTLRTQMLMESRRQNQELQAQRKLAETAEASRLSELRAQLEGEFARLRDVVQALEGQMAQHEESLRQALDEATHGIEALVGEMDDKIDRALAQVSTASKGA